MPDNPAFEKWHKEHYPRAHALVKDAKRDIFRQMLRAAWDAATEHAAKIADERRAYDVTAALIAAAIREGANHAREHVERCIEIWRHVLGRTHVPDVLKRALARMQEANRDANTGGDLNDVLPWLRTIRELVTAMMCEAHLLQTFPVMMQAFLLLVEAQTIEAEAKQIVIDCN